MKRKNGFHWQMLTMSILFLTLFSYVAWAAPTSVTLVGDLQDELGCPGDWAPDCAATYLTEIGNDVWRGVFTIPTGNWLYKNALNDTWDESYPVDDKILAVGADTAVHFYYDDKTKAVVDDVNDEIPVAAGSFQSEIGCPGDWQPECVRSLLTDADGDGVYTFTTTGLTVGSYEFKVALDEAWDTAYPGANVPFTTTTTDEIVTITWDSVTTDVIVAISLPELSWVVAGNFQDDLPVSAACGEWNNACPETTMEDDNGDGVFRFVADSLPAASYEYKIVESGNWDNAYPAGNVPFTADGSQMRWYFQPGSNNIADNANQCIATVAGNIQSLLGGSDWSPDNLRSMLWQEDPGSDWYAFTATLPAGDYEYKVARDEAWDESYPDDNVALSLSAETAVTFRYNCTSNAVEHSFGGSDPGDADLVANPVSHPIQDDIFYFVLSDRFEDGDPSNNTGGIVGDETDHGFLVDDKAFYHGGDLAGLTARLDYLDNLGVTAIWMTPIFKNNPVQADSSTSQGVGAAYHGYWIVDFLNTDPHLGTNAELEALIAAAHARDMKIFFDIVINHTGDIIDYAEGDDAYRSKADYPYVDANGNVFDDADYAGTGTFPPLDAATSFPYMPVLDTGEDTAKNPAWLNDPIYYHNRGNSTFSGENSFYGDFFGLDDLFTEHPDVVTGMTDIFKTWITDYRVDGFRIDTVKHVNTEFWQAFGPEIMSHADTEGISEFFMFGEVFDGNPAFLSTFTGDGELPSVLDFGMQGTAASFAARSEATDNVANFFAGDDYYTDPDSSAYQLANFISNHDIGRVGKAIQDNNGGAADAEMVSRSELAHALMYFSRGFPVLYYGDEQGFTGDGGDKDAREDMMPSQVAVYNDNNLIGTTATTADSNFDDTHPLYQTLQDYAGLRAAHPALNFGAQIHRYSQDSAGIYAFSRIDRTEQIEYLVVLNNAEGSASATFATFSPVTTFTQIYPGAGTVTSDANGNVSVTLDGLTVTIYRADQAIPASSSAPGITFNTPAADDSVNGRIEVGVDLSENKLAEVTFLVSIDGGAYKLIGVDTNAAYRVFYDTEGLAEGTALTFKAIVSDLNGNLASTTTNATVGATSAGGDAAYAIIHYFRDDGDYGDHTSGDYNDFWGLHLWGDAIDPSEGTDWTNPKPFLGEDEYGRFAWIKLADPSQPVNFIVHRGDTKDGTDADRQFNAGVNPEIWLKQDDATEYSSQAAAQGYVTIYYHRDDGDYGTPSADYTTYWGLHLWGDAIADGVGTDWTSPRPFDGIDDYGAYWNVPLKAVDVPVNFIIHRGDAKDPGPDQSMIPADNASIFIQSGDETIFPSRGAAENTIYLRYHRADGDYGDPTSADYNDFWGMHVWTGALNPNPAWTDPVRPVGLDIFGPLFVVPMQANATELAYILHRGDTKDPGPDQFLTLDKWGYEVWQVEGEGPDPAEPHYVLPVLGEPGANPGNINQQSAYWVDADTIAWAAADSTANTYTLNYAPDGGLVTSDNGVTGGSNIVLTPGVLSDAVKAKFPHLAALPALKINSGDLALVPEILKGQIAVTAVNPDGLSVNATGLQIPGVLDDLYTYNGDLGVSWDGSVPTVRVWAPTAKSVSLHLFADPDPGTTSSTLPMTWDASTGVWSITGEASWKDQFYLFDVEVYVHSTGLVEHNMVTDPYSVSLSTNSQRSQIVDLNDAALEPAGWDNVEKPELVAPEDISIYEIHVRDFSVNDPTVPDELEGTFKAFTLEGTYGVEHLKALEAAGLSHLHLLPVFDIATINEDRSQWQSPDPALLATYPPDSEEQQAAVTAVEDLDGFNWGYDPLHYTTPEGSYSTNPDGTTRIVEFREMVQAVNEDIGLRVVMDVVYNHTNASGQSENSVLDRIVPGYYHRLNDTGQVETSTCCANTASEHNMMEKLMIDSLVTWAVQYKVDAFRFDLMGHHMLRNMENVRAALDALTLADDGVDGKSIYLYGEGWNFGEVADNARGVNATQLNVGGLGIGTFSDRLRDGVRGGGPFDGGQDLIRRQGFANGLYYDPNALNSGSQAELDTLLLVTDQIRVGMAGNLAGYQFVDRNGDLVTGAEVDYNGQPAGYTLDPQENISYISKHDNQTLFDNNIYKIPLSASMQDRVRIQNVGLSTVLLGQGVPFMHAGSDLLRSKSLDRDSFNSGDWFNQLDFTYQSNNFGVGLPVAGKNQDNWSIMQPLLADTSLQPNSADIMQTAGLFQELLTIRDSSRLFRLETGSDIQERVVFHNTGPNQLPGLIVMSISDYTAVDLDRDHEFVVVLINANDEAQSFTSTALAGFNLELHPVQVNSIDPVVKTAAFDAATGTFAVPGRTTAVFVVEATPQERIAFLQADVQALMDAGLLQSHFGRILLRDLQQAERFLNRGHWIFDYVAAVQMRIFIQHVQLLVRLDRLPAEEGQLLIDDAWVIIRQILER